MADNTTIEQAQNGSSAIRKIFTKMGVSSTGTKAALARLISRAWRVSGAPTVDANSHGTYPVLKGDLLYDYTNDDGYTCTVTPAASTAGTFVKVNA